MRRLASAFSPLILLCLAASSVPAFAGVGSDCPQVDGELRLDLDSDGDGVPDIFELILMASDTEDGEILTCIPFDTDDDGIFDVFDEDDDGDTVLTKVEILEWGSGPITTWEPFDFIGGLEAEGIAHHLHDWTYTDLVVAVGRIKAATPDTDNDGMPNYIDDDDDGDLIPTAVECPDGELLDRDGDGVPNCFDIDSDGDGALDRAEGTEDHSGNGIPNYLDPGSNYENRQPPEQTVEDYYGFGVGCSTTSARTLSLWALLLPALLLGRRQRRPLR